MSTHDHHEIIKQICDFMGEDLNARVCKEVAEHLAACPTCQVYFDTVRRTVTLCREIEQDKKIPEKMNKRLFKILNLDKLNKKE